MALPQNFRPHQLPEHKQKAQDNFNGCNDRKDQRKSNTQFAF